MECNANGAAGHQRQRIYPLLLAVHRTTTACSNSISQPPEDTASAEPPPFSPTLPHAYDNRRRQDSRGSNRIVRENEKRDLGRSKRKETVAKIIKKL